jgi:hypothetical protein
MLPWQYSSAVISDYLLRIRMGAPLDITTFLETQFQIVRLTYAGILTVTIRVEYIKIVIVVYLAIHSPISKHNEGNVQLVISN